MLPGNGSTGGDITIYNAIYNGNIPTGNDTIGV
jgi:hypothetical protein